MKFFAINKNQAALLSTILSLLTLGSAYFFIYLPNNEKRIQEQHFSALQNIDRNIHTKIENSIALLNNLLNSSMKDSAKWKEYTAWYSATSVNFRFTTPEFVPLPKKETSKYKAKDTLYTVRVNDDTKEVNLLFSKQEAVDKNDLDSGYTISVNNDTREISLYFFRKVAAGTYKAGMKFSFEQFIKFLFPKDAFDEYIVFSKGKPVYESFPAGISYVKEDSLLGAKNGIGSSGIRNQLLSGTEYKMFLQPVGFDANNEWIIGGLLTTKHYQSEKTQLSTQIILLLVTIMLIGMVAFPWLKLYQMGSKDRLTISDGVASIFISMLLISLIFFVFFNYNLPFRPVNNKAAKTYLANGIHKAFKDEIDSVYHKLQEFDRLVIRHDSDIINLDKDPSDKDSIAFADGKMPPEYAAKIREVSNGANINQVFWVNKNGGEIRNWSVDKMNGPRGNFKNREYFKGIIEHRQYRINDTDTAGFYLEQGISWTTGVFRSVISIKSKLSALSDPVVAALSFNFKSLDKAVLPAGYLFAITDGSGNVLYHSEPSRNMNENLLNVFSKKDKLKSFLDAKAPGTFATKYYGNDYEVEVKPVDGLPYYIIIFENSVYHETRDLETYSFTFSMLFIFFGLLVLQLFAIFLVSAKRSFFKKQLFNTSWIGPKISNHHEYMLSAIFNCIIIFLLVVFFNRVTFLEYFFMLLFSVTLIPLFLTSVLVEKYFRKKNNVVQFKKSAKYCLWRFIAITMIIALKILDGRNIIFLLAYGIFVILCGIGLYFTKESIYRTAYKIKASSSRYTLLFGKWDYVKSFALMALTRLIITSGLPVVFFYISSRNYEENLGIRYKHIDFARQLLNRLPSDSVANIRNRDDGDIYISAPDSGQNVTPAGKQTGTGRGLAKSVSDTLTNQKIINANSNGVYYDNSIVKPVLLTSRYEARGDTITQRYSDEELRTIQLFKLFRLYVTDKAVIEDQFDSHGTTGSSFLFNHLLKNATEKADKTITYNQSALPGKYLKIQSKNLNYHFPTIFTTNAKNWYNGMVFWVLLITTLLIFYFIIVSIIKKLFSLNLPDLEIWKKLDDKILINKSVDQPLFVIGLPGSGKKKYLLDKITNGEITMPDGTPLYFDNPYEQKNNVFIAELINIPSSGNEEAEKLIWDKYTKKVFDEKNRIIIVNHFEYNIQDPVSNRFKLEFLERLYLEHKARIIILSTIHPVAFLDSANDPAFMPKAELAAGQDLERWHVLLGHYRIIILPLQLPFVHSASKLLDGSIIRLDNGEGIPDVSIRIPNSSIESVTMEDGQFILPDQPMPFIIVVSLEGYLTKEIIVQSDNDLIKIGLAQGDSYLSSELLRQETNHTYFLKKLQPPAFEAGKTLSEDTRKDKSDELAFKIQVSSHYFYMYIWQSLTKEEKFLLYDLAEDNLVNSFDDYNLSMLIAKGVVIRPDGTLKLFNKGFRNFILTAIGTSEAIKIKNRIKENGNWNTLKNPLQLVILAILAFLLTSQEEAFAKLITYVAALGAGVPAVLKLFSLFDKNSQKPG